MYVKTSVFFLPDQKTDFITAIFTLTFTIKKINHTVHEIIPAIISLSKIQFGITHSCTLSKRISKERLNLKIGYNSLN